MSDTQPILDTGENSSIYLQMRSYNAASSNSDRPPSYASSVSLDTFVRSHFNKRECCQFIPEKKNSTTCGCGQSEVWHEERHIPRGEGERWSVTSCTEASPTDAFGKVEMLGFSGGGAFDKAKFLRIDAQSNDFDKLQDFMLTHWKMQPPSLILAINGGSKKMEKCDQKLLSIIKRGLYHTSTSLKTWIITNGTFDGVSRVIGEAVQERPIEARMETGAFVAIGILSWGTVFNSESLVNKPTNGRMQQMLHKFHRYVNTPCGPQRGQVILDPNHTHFLLVDDGTVRKYNREVDFRHKFEDYFIGNNQLIEGCKAQKIQLLFEGGHAALPFLEEAVNFQSPIVVVKHSGRCADLICNMLSRTTLTSTRKEIQDIFEEEMATNFRKWELKGDVRELCLNTITRLVLMGRNFLHIFDYNDEDNDELDKFLLGVIFKHNAQLTASQKMTLTMSMRRCDLALQEVFNFETDRRGLNMNYLMTEALQSNQVDFVELLLREGIVIQQYLSAAVLCQLYSHQTNKLAVAERFLHKILQTEETDLGCRKCCCCSPHVQSDQHSLMTRVGKLIFALTNEILPVYYDDAIDFQESTQNTQVYHLDSADLLDVTNEMEVVEVYEDEEGQKSGQEEMSVAGREHGISFGSPSKGWTVAYPKFPPRNKYGQRIFTEFDLFLWAILHNRIGLAKVFWRTGKDQISCALVASAILTEMRDLAVNEGEVSLAAYYEQSAQEDPRSKVGRLDVLPKSAGVGFRYPVDRSTSIFRPENGAQIWTFLGGRGKDVGNATEFEALTLELLSTAYFCGKKRTHILLCRSLHQWGGNTCLSMAYQFSSMAFLQHTACQTRLNRIWMGAMPSSTPILWILVNIILAPILIRSIFPVPVTSSDEQYSSNHSLDGSEPHKAQSEEKKKHMEDNVVQLSKDHHNKSYCQALMLFYTAPITKFIIYVFSYLVFLFILTYFILIALEPTNAISDVSVWEYLAWVWCVDIIFEEIRQVVDQSQATFLSKCRNWLLGIGSSWNKFDLCAILLFILSVILRFTVPARHFVYVRFSYGLMIALFYLRFLQFYFAHRNIGPKVVMINKMLSDLAFFVCIYVVFIMAYGTFLQALLYPNKDPTISVISDIVHVPFWQTFGEMNLDYLKGNGTCEVGTRGCGGQSPLGTMLGGIFVMAVNILLINLLIALFGYTIGLVQESSERVWSFYRFGLVQEFQQRPPAPPPFTLISIIILYLLACCRRRKRNLDRRKPNQPFEFNLEVGLDRKIAHFENNCAQIYCSKEIMEGDNGGQDGGITKRMQSILAQLQQLRNPQLTNVTTFEPQSLGQGVGEQLINAELRSRLRTGRTPDADDSVDSHTRKEKDEETKKSD